MLKNLRLVVIDYPKLLLDNQNIKRFMGDMLAAKQLNFERTNENYVPFSALDMISTHIFVYDTTNIFQPEQIYAVRMSYEYRCKKHGIPMPYECYDSSLPDWLLARFKDFHKGKDLIDCGSLYLDKKWSGKKAGRMILDIGYLVLYSRVFRMAENHMICAVNERYKMSRTFNNIGEFSRENVFTHPQVPNEHLLILMKSIHPEWVQEKLTQFKEIYERRIEINPSNSEDHRLIYSDQELKTWLDSKIENPQGGFREVGLESRKLIAS